MRTNTRVNPRINIEVEIIICLLREESFWRSRSSSTETPVIKEKYAGKSGIIQGEKKDKRPAPSAADILTDCSNIIICSGIVKN
jgi:hypothetical protein